MLWASFGEAPRFPMRPRGEADDLHQASQGISCPCRPSTPRPGDTIANDIQVRAVSIRKYEQNSKLIVS